jgi:hypothetical protein
MARVIAREHRGHLLLVARRKDRLDALAEELRGAYGVDVITLQADMTRKEDVVRTFEEATAGRAVHAAVLNAGVSYFGHGIELPFEEFERMLATNVTSVVYLTQRFLQHQIARGEGGGTMIVSSVAGTVPTTYQAAYCGTKAFLNNFGLAMAEEVAGRGVSLTVFAPGGIATEMGEKTGTARKFKKGDLGMMDPDVCAKKALDGFVARRRFVIPGALNQMNDLLLRFTPRWLASATTRRLYEAALPSSPKR